MKHNSCFFIGLFLITISHAQIFEGNAFIKTPLIELGINICGGYITDTIPPGFVNAGSDGVFGEVGYYGFIADHGYDGWDIGDPPYSGDFVSPGDPVEGWGIEFNGDLYLNSDTQCVINEIPGSIIDYFESPDSIWVIWEGSISDVTIRQTTTAYPTNLYFITRVMVINTSTDTLNDMYYFRNMDPDNEQYCTGDFTTELTVDDDSNYVSSKGLIYGLYLALVSGDELAQGSYGNFWTSDVSSISNAYNGVGAGVDGYQTEGTLWGDIAIQLSFYRPFIEPNDTIQFSFAHVFAPDLIDEVYAKTINNDIDYICEFETAINISNITYTSAISTWPDAVGHNYELIITNTETGELDTFSTYTSPYNLTELDSCTLYEVILITNCEGEDVISDTSEFITGCIDTTLSIINELKPEDILIYPNPANSILNITISELINENGMVTIYDMIGNVLLHKSLSNNTTTISITDIVSGAYIVTVDINNNIIRKGLIIQKK